MDELVKMLLSPTFWVGSVAVGIAINLVSPSISAGLAKLSRSFADKRRERMERRDKLDHNIAVMLRSSTDSLIRWQGHEQRAYLRGISWGVIACFCLGMAIYVGQAEFPAETPWYWTNKPLRLGCGLLATMASVVGFRAMVLAGVYQSVLRQSVQGTKIELAEEIAEREGRRETLATFRDAAVHGAKDAVSAVPWADKK